MPAINPLAYPANPAYLAQVLALDPAIHAERRLQSILHIWMLRYFSGTPFTTRAPTGTVQRTLTHCDFAWQEDQLAEAPPRPILHLVMPDRRTTRCDYQPHLVGHRDDWFIDLMVKVAPALATTSMPGVSAEEVCRTVAGEAEWLFSSSEREALDAHGIFDLQVQRPAVILPSSAWKMRLLVLSCRSRRELPR